jgi:hypothetical protein
MKTISTPLQLFLESGAPFFGADIYEVKPVIGATFYATSFDRPISYGGNLYPVARTQADYPAMNRSAIQMGVGLTGSKIDVEMIAGPNAQIAGQPALVQLAQNYWANAYVVVRRCFMTAADVNFNGIFGPAICNLTGAATGTGDGTMIWFAGNVGTVGPISNLKAKFEVCDLIYQLDRPTPKNLIGPGCWHQLFDEGCTLSPSGSYGGVNFTQTGAVQAGSTTQVIQTNITNAAQPSAPASAPTITDAGNQNVTLAAGTYFAVVTYVTATGETLASPEGILALPPNHVPIVDHPPSVAGATGWNCYIGLQSGDEQLQNGAPLSFAVNYTVPNLGISLSGILPPVFPTNGIFAQGVLSFTSGALSGLSAYVEAYDPSTGAFQLRTPMIVAPSASDTISAVVGCNKSMATCLNTFNNLAHAALYPFTPTPESSF